MTEKRLLPSPALNEAFETESAVSDTSDTPMTNNFEIPQIQIPQDSQINPMSPSIHIEEAFVPNDTSSASNFGMLSSANFSTDSLNDTTEPFVDYYNNSNSNNGSPRRYSNSSLTNSPRIGRANSNSATSRSRPLSAFLMDSSNAISEDGQPIQPVFNNTPRSRNSLTFGIKTPVSSTFANNYTPPPLAAPTGPYRSSSPTRQSSPLRINKHYRSTSPVRRGSSPTKANNNNNNNNSNPFNFQSQDLMYQTNLNVSNGSNLSLPVKPAHRKGHKYKHSSISMNLFQEPPPVDIGMTQLSAIPDLYPIPNFNETLNSITPNQKLRFMWSGFHVGLSLIIFTIGFKFKLPSLSTLAHLVFYDSLGSLLIVFVDTMSNFDVWNKSSLAYPFGLGRIEVLVGFALSTSLVMVGFDLFSHFIEEFIILWVSPDNHDDHEHLSHNVHAEPGNNGNSNWFIYIVVLIVTMAVSLFSSNYILTYDRITEMINGQDDTDLKGNFPTKRNISNGSLINEANTIDNNTTGEKLKKIVSAWKKNPTHLITLSYTLFLLVGPLIPQSLTSDLAIDINEAATITVALLLCYNGWKLVKTLGGILLCSFPYSDYDYHVLKSRIIDQILSKDFFKQTYRIEKFFITKFNYRLFVIGMKINMKGANSDEEVRMRFEINRIICNELEKLDNSSKLVKPEITIDIDRF